MRLKYVGVAVLVTAILSAALTRYYFPRVQTKIEEKQVIKKDIRTIIKEVVKKDGTKETTTEIVDNSQEDRSIIKELTMERNWHLSGSYGQVNFKSPPIYGLQVERRILGPFFVGVRADTEKTYSLTFGAEF